MTRLCIIEPRGLVLIVVFVDIDCFHNCQFSYLLILFLVLFLLVVVVNVVALLVVVFSFFFVALITINFVFRGDTVDQSSEVIRRTTYRQLYSRQKHGDIHCQHPYDAAIPTCMGAF